MILYPHFWKSLTSAHHVPSHLGPTIIKMRTTRGHTPLRTNYLVPRSPHHQWPLPSLYEAIQLHSHNMLHIWNQFRAFHSLTMAPAIPNTQYSDTCVLQPQQNLLSFDPVFFLSASSRLQFYLLLTLTDSRNFMLPSSF